MNKIRVPGKVMLSGEYAVLYGAKAMMMPVPRFLEISETEDRAEESQSHVAQTALKLHIPEIAEFEEIHGIARFNVDSRSFYDEDMLGKTSKLGLGCSAAEAVAVISLRFLRAGKSPAHHKQEILKYALAAHKAAQQGLGSGADVAVCTYKEPVRYSLSEQEYSLEFVKLNQSEKGVQLNLAWTGQAADTRSMVAWFQNWYRKGGRRAKDLAYRLIKASDILASIWFDSSKKELFQLLDEFSDVMARCARAAGIPYFLPIHEEIGEWAKRHGGRAKPTGAGGGDMILLIGELPINELKRLFIPLRLRDMPAEA